MVLAVLGLLVRQSAYVSSRNQMVTKNVEAVKSAWAQVDVVLQRRADLIPNLVETVKGFAAQEQTVFHDIAAARSALLGAQTPADKIAANGQLDGALGRLLVIVENLSAAGKSNENLFCGCRMNSREPKIASPWSAKHYNWIRLQDYNTYVGLFPNSLFCRLGRIPTQQCLLYG